VVLQVGLLTASLAGAAAPLALRAAWPDAPVPLRLRSFDTLEQRMAATIDAREPAAAIAMLNESPDPNRVLPDGRTLLMAAAQAGYEELFLRMIELFGGDIDHLRPDGYSMLMAAGEGGNARIFDYVYQRNGTKPAASARGFSVPMAVARGGNSALFRRIEGVFAAQSPTTADGYTLLMAAAEGGDKRIFENVLLLGAIRREAVAENGWSVLHAAAMGGNEDIVAAALEWVAVDLRDADLRTPLWVAARHNRSAAAERLLDAGADPAAADRNGVTPLMLAIENTNRTLAGRLIEGGAGPDAADRHGVTALHRAIALNLPEEAVFLINRGASIARADNDGDTPLHYAVRAKSARMVAFLLRRGADVDMPNGAGVSARDLARSIDFGPVLRIIQALPEP